MFKHGMKLHPLGSRLHIVKRPRPGGNELRAGARVDDFIHRRGFGADASHEVSAVATVRGEVCICLKKLNKKTTIFFTLFLSLLLSAPFCGFNDSPRYHSVAGPIRFVTPHFSEFTWFNSGGAAL